MSNEIARLVARDGSYFTCFLFNPFPSVLAFEKQETELNSQAVSYINGEISFACFSHHFELPLETTSEVHPDSVKQNYELKIHIHLSSPSGMKNHQQCPGEAETEILFQQYLGKLQSFSMIGLSLGFQLIVAYSSLLISPQLSLHFTHWLIMNSL